MKKIKTHYIISGLIGLAIYLIATGMSYAIFSYYGTGDVPAPAVTVKRDSTGKTIIDPGIPKTQICPLNGMMYTQQEEDVWKTRRPLAVMIENHVEARPQSGLSYADIVYEGIVEGGTTRFMGVFYCGVSSQDIGLAPVRSARVPFLPWVLEYDALYNHVGGAGNCVDETVDERAKALCQIEQFKIKDMDQFGISFPTCFRNYDRLGTPVATEHTMVCYTDKLFKLAATRKWTNVDAKGVSWDKNFQSWQFKDDAKESERGNVASISYVAWKGNESNFGVRWEYDATSNSYKRIMAGVPHKDLETDKQLEAKSIIVTFAKETGPVDSHGHLIYETVGTGDGIFFADGKATKVTWKKPTRTARTKYFDESNKEIALTRGQVWVILLPTGTSVTY